MSRSRGRSSSKSNGFVLDVSAHLSLPAPARYALDGCHRLSACFWLRRHVGQLPGWHHLLARLRSIRCAGRRRRCSPIYSSWSVLAYKRSPSPSSLIRTCASISCSTDWAIPFLRLLNQLPRLLFRPTLGVLTPGNPVDGPRSWAPLRAARILGYSAASETGANCQCAGPAHWSSNRRAFQ